MFVESWHGLNVVVVNHWFSSKHDFKTFAAALKIRSEHFNCYFLNFSLALTVSIVYLGFYVK